MVVHTQNESHRLLIKDIQISKSTQNSLTLTAGDKILFMRFSIPMLQSVKNHGEMDPYLLWLDITKAVFHQSTMAVCVKPIALEKEGKSGKSPYEG